MVKRRRINNAAKNRVDRSPPPTRADELVSARDRFKGALQDLLPHSEAESDSGSDDDNWSKSKKNQKKKIQNDKGPESKQPQPFVMKLFDRSVDLAQFTENTPLYVICRAWMANQPHQTYSIAVPTPKRPRTPEIKEEPLSPSKEEDLVRDTYWLPPPSDENNETTTNVRIPSPSKRTTDYNTLFQKDVEPPTKEELLEDNRKHWIKVRKTWHEASKRNEDRYQKSLKTLVAIFNKAQRQQAPC